MKDRPNVLHDLIIIGAGPAGLTAALYARRYRLNTLLLEKMSAGGQIILSSRIENFPGFPGGITTQELIDRFKTQVDELVTDIKYEEVLEIGIADEKKDLIYSVKTPETTHWTKVLIIASGAQSKRLKVKGEDRLIGSGVSYCGTCDGPLFKNKEIVVVGAGDRALEEAIFLSSYALKVSVIHRRSVLRASQILQEKAKENLKINFVLDSVVEEIIGENKVRAVKIKNLKNGEPREIDCEGVFIFVGISPNTAFLKEFVELDQAGFVIADKDMQTSRQGVFACGDCLGKSFYQVINACGEGAVAAYSANRCLL